MLQGRSAARVPLRGTIKDRLARDVWMAVDSPNKLEQLSPRAKGPTPSAEAARHRTSPTALDISPVRAIPIRLPGMLLGRVVGHGSLQCSFGCRRRRTLSAVGQSSNVVELSRVARELSQLVGDIEARLRLIQVRMDVRKLSTSSGEKSSSPEAAEVKSIDGGTDYMPHGVFLRLCKECKEASQDIQDALGKLQANGTRKLSLETSSVLVALKSVWSADRIQGMEERLNNLRQQIMTAVLFLLRQKDVDFLDYAQQQASIANILQKVDATTKKFSKEVIDCLLGKTPESRQSMDRLVKYVLSPHWNSKDFLRDHVSQEGGPSEAADNAANIYSLYILASLYFTSMGHREADVAKAYAATCDWIFQEPPRSDNNSNLWSSFPLWLENPSNDIYWITGKPGVGKSTLMKFIINDRRLVENFERKRGTSNSADRYTRQAERFTIASYFSWIAGTNTLQKSHAGMLRTLLHQMRGILRPRRFFRGKVDFPEWDLTELLAAFDKLVSFSAESAWNILLVIDGLDEFNEDHGRLISLFRKINNSPSVKICTSSRPWNIFKDAYKQSPKLQVEKLTRAAIEIFVRRRLEASGGFQELEATNGATARELIHHIVERAQGVFLWVSAVVGMLERQLTSETDDKSRVVYMHRTGKDWVLQRWPEMLKHTEGFDPRRTLVKGEVLRISVTSVAMTTRFWKEIKGLLGFAAGLRDDPKSRESISTPCKDEDRGKAAVGFMGYVAQIPIVPYIKAKVEDTGKIRQNKSSPMASALENVIFGGVPHHPLYRRGAAIYARHLDTSRVELVVYVLGHVQFEPSFLQNVSGPVQEERESGSINPEYWAGVAAALNREFKGSGPATSPGLDRCAHFPKRRTPRRRIMAIATAAAATAVTRRWLPSRLRRLTTITTAPHDGSPCYYVHDARRPVRPSSPFPGLLPPFAGRSPSVVRRSFSGTATPQKHRNFPPRPKPPPESEIEESFLKGSGPGGQKINKTNSAVQLKHIPTGIVVKSQATRSRSQNRTIARQLLADRLDDLARGGESRSAVVGEVRRKKRASSAKKSRRKYRRLAEEQQEDEAEEGQEEEVEVGVEGGQEERRVEEEERRILVTETTKIHGGRKNDRKDWTGAETRLDVHFTPAPQRTIR
ncbi:hypothetical protein DL764_001546 [Monosporascus ibericus]|uniref:Uncharacterized protein n=1 Tax=Monosporascus ibericus TaxID=155417 RepID=A0A4Q4TTY2_9PEZI|nr:hypothetical protein DL764_001546 [Monosporascus ibericus]